MSQCNAETLQSYDRHVADYVDGTAQEVSGPSRNWIDAALAGLPAEAEIFELGSAFGRDAAYIRGRGYRVDCSDASRGFVDHLRGLGVEARLFNALTDPLAGPWHLILANAVLLHFNREECAAVLAKMAGALAPGGRFAFSLKAGEGEGWSSHKLNAPRYFCYWQPEQLPPLLRQAGFQDWEITAADTDRQHGKWLYVIARTAG